MPAKTSEIYVRLAGSTQRVVIRLTRHAVQRFVERARPCHDIQSGALEIARLADVASVSNHAAHWDTTRRPAQLYLTIGDVSFPLTPHPADQHCLIACTCVVRGMAGRRRAPRRGASTTPCRPIRPYRRPSPGSKDWTGEVRPC